MSNLSFKKTSLIIISILILIISGIVVLLILKTSNQAASTTKIAKTVSNLSQEIGQNSNNISVILKTENPTQLITAGNINNTLDTITKQVPVSSGSGNVKNSFTNIYNFDNLKSIIVNPGTLDLSQAKVEIVNENLKIIQIQANQDLTGDFKKLVTVNLIKKQGLNYSYILQGDTLKYLGDDVEYAKSVIIDQKSYIFMVKYAANEGYPKYFLTNLNNQEIEVKLPFDVPLNIYTSADNANQIYIEANEGNGRNITTRIYLVDLSKLIADKANVIIKIENKPN